MQSHSENDPHVNTKDPFISIMLYKWLALRHGHTFANRCKTLHRLQNLTGTGIRQRARAGGLFAHKFFCKKIKIQIVQAGAV